jgi:hypothetical protein
VVTRCSARALDTTQLPITPGSRGRGASPHVVRIGLDQSVAISAEHLGAAFSLDCLEQLQTTQRLDVDVLGDDGPL